jgi:hypothetical protein
VGEVTCVQDIAWKPEGKRSLERPRYKWKEMLKWLLEKSGGWIHLAQDRDRWRALVSMMMKLWFHIRRGFF